MLVGQNGELTDVVEIIVFYACHAMVLEKKMNAM